MKCVYSTMDPMEAEFICMALRDHDVPSHLEDTQGWRLPQSAIPWRIHVAEEAVERAVAIIREVLEARRRASKPAQS